ncbi:hypothetical protein FA15DRAFT_700929 [Coprinopsis marcescibilis]|uniref:Cytosine-purine permease n=1 Tax=Coprinopsis marcescibilis TaxID=230819 RepID=A0A5C3L711_COPMA|nr:hypothetical protein FA15DRAFT_700929 [Coprinopsis marcescibilis]
MSLEEKHQGLEKVPTLLADHGNPVMLEAGSEEQLKPVYGDRWTKRLLRIGVEDRGVQPIPIELRTDTQLYKVFFIWFSWNINILTFSAGTLGPVVFGLGLRDTCLTILFFNLLCCLPAAYLCTWGPKTGMRQMVLSRYAFGYYGVIIPSIFNLVTMLGFSILSAILGGQALASITTNLSWTVGIVVIGVISLLVSFCGFNVFSCPKIPSWKIFFCVYIALSSPVIILQCLGAVAAVAAPNVPEWQIGYEGRDVGGLLEAMLHPAGNFGKFLTVLLSISVVGNMAGISYSSSFNLQLVVALAIPGAHRFYDTLLNFLGLIGYWSGAFFAIVLAEHLCFRRNNCDNYDISAWDVPHRLPSGLAALGAGFGSLALVVPSMHQVWFIGPIAEFTGDIGFEMAFALGGLLYVPLRWLEIKIQKRV